ncbi:MAG: BamA/TamA family outer membrane protein [Bacteroidia bacterium]|nr:BamA/TamA family outer membrane protein [Bacteroidia bacterium]
MQAKLHNSWFWSGALLLAFAFAGCKATRHLGPDEYLIKSYPRYRGAEALSSSELGYVVRTRPNRRLIVPKFSLHVHNTGVTAERLLIRKRDPIGPDDEVRGLVQRSVRWLKYGLGDPPELLDEEQLDRDRQNLHSFAVSRGFFHPQVSYEIDTLRHLLSGRPKQKARVSFLIQEGVAYTIRQVSLRIGDSTEHTAHLRSAYRMSNCLLKPGERYNQDLIGQERARGYQALRNSGFYSLTPEMLSFTIDTTVNGGLAAARGARPVRQLDIEIVVARTPPRYKIGEITVRVRAARQDSSLGGPLRLRAADLAPALRDSLRLPYHRFDSTLQLTFVADPLALRRVNYNFIAQRIHQTEGLDYLQSRSDRTYRRLQELGMLRYTLITYRPDSLLSAQPEVNMLVEMQLASRYQVKIGAEAFTRDLTSTNLPGVGATLGVRDKNIRGRSEQFELSTSGNVGFYATDNTQSQFSNLYYEIGAQASLRVHQYLFTKPLLFLLPDKYRRDLSRYSPLTQLSSTFRIEDRQEYRRLSVGGNLGYQWNHIPFSDRAVSRITPLAADFIDVPENSISADFRKRLDGLPPNIRRDFQERFSSRFQYSYTEQNYRSTRASPTFWTRFAVEWGGNLPYLIDRLGIGRGQDTSASDTRLFGRFFYGQYVKASAETRWFFPLTPRTEIVVRGMIGASTPYNNTPAVPQESRFFAGGINGMRGWQSNTLGPGRTGVDDFPGGTENLNFSSLIAPGGEFQIELNAEYRFDVAQYIELAVFTDAGNVWFSKRSSEQLGLPTAGLTRENLRLGWDAGIGLRFDFSYVVFRIDIGQQLYAPDLDKGWVFAYPQGSIGRRLWPSYGINYPF